MIALVLLTAWGVLAPAVTLVIAGAIRRRDRQVPVPAPTPASTAAAPHQEALA